MRRRPIRRDPPHGDHAVKRRRCPARARVLRTARGMIAALAGVDDATAPQEHTAPRPVPAATGEAPPPAAPAPESPRAVRRTLHDASADGRTERPRHTIQRDPGRAGGLAPDVKALAGLDGGVCEGPPVLTTARRRRQAELLDSASGSLAPAPVASAATVSYPVVPPWGDSRTGTDATDTGAQRPLATQRRVWELQTWDGAAPNALSLSRGEPPGPSEPT